MKEEYIILELPLCPSINEAYAGYPKRHKTYVYKTWEQLASIELQKQTKYKIIGDNWLNIDINVFLPLYYKNWKKKKQDIDNFIKITLDFLTKNIEWFEDEKIKEINIKKIDSENKIIKLKIKEIW